MKTVKFLKTHLDKVEGDKMETTPEHADYLIRMGVAEEETGHNHKEPAKKEPKAKK